MKKITQKWLDFAKSDLNAAEILFNNESYKDSIFHCHQAIEKYLKAAIVERGRVFPKIHDLPELLAITKFKFSDKIILFLQELDSYYNPSRYPDVAPDYTYERETAERFLELTKEIIKWIELQMTQSR
jgi:HEPN domain-containing protein